MSDAADREFARFRRTGDAQGLANAFDATAPELLRVASYLLPHADVEDAVHDAFVVAMSRHERWDAGRPLLPWLLGVLANEARSRRRRRRLQAAAATPAPAPAPDPVAEASSRELAERLEAALRSIDRDDGALLRLHLFDELSCREIGERLGR